MLHPIGIAGRGAARVSRQPMACSTAARALRRVARAYSTRPPHLTLFTGPQCSLCDDAKEVLDEVHRTVPFTLATYNIRDDSAPDVAHWRRKYQYEIPVLHARWDGDPGYGRGACSLTRTLPTPPRRGRAHRRAQAQARIVT